MNNKRYTTFLFLIISFLFFGCSGPETGNSRNKASASSLSLHAGDERYIKIDTKQSVVAWKGSGVHGGHTGYVYISKGELMIENGQLMGGAVEVDMSTIEGDDHRSDNNLIKHLKDADFFDVEKFPFSTMAISKVASINAEEKEITGNLTIKGITHPVTFPVKMEMEDGIVKTSGKLVIDRTLWDVRYMSGRFFDHLKNQAIADSIEFQIYMVAKK
jgi:polyisoprenoid-binding protein YceI